MQRAVPIVAVLAIAACSSNTGANSLPSGGGNIGTYAPVAGRQISLPASSFHPVCSGSRINQAQCDVLVGPAVEPAIGGITQPEILQAYNLKPTGGKGQIVAIVDAYDNPNAASDLAAYRSYFGIPAANFTKYNQTGQTSNYPAGNTGWGLEEDLDIEMVSVSCPLCTIYLVEANSNNSSDLSAAEAEAAKLGATVISNSYDGGGMVQSDFSQKGITYVASAGDASLRHQLSGELRPRLFRSAARCWSRPRANAAIRKSSGRIPARDARRNPSRHGKKTLAVRIVRPTMFQPSRPTLRSTTPTAIAAGSRSPARAFRRR